MYLLFPSILGLNNLARLILLIECTKAYVSVCFEFLCDCNFWIIPKFIPFFDLDVNGITTAVFLFTEITTQ